MPGDGAAVMGAMGCKVIAMQQARHAGDGATTARGRWALWVRLFERLKDIGKGNVLVHACMCRELAR